MLLNHLWRNRFSDWLSLPLQSVDFLAYILLQCPYVLQYRLNWIMPCLDEWTMLPLETLEQIFEFLLEDSDSQCTYFFTAFLETAERYWKDMCFIQAFLFYCSRFRFNNRDAKRNSSFYGINKSFISLVSYYFLFPNYEIFLATYFRIIWASQNCHCSLCISCVKIANKSIPETEHGQ